ncbi:MAG TPA: hypothetical protein VGH32_03670 [Pirellulales bacterium]
MNSHGLRTATTVSLILSGLCVGPGRKSIAAEKPERKTAVGIDGEKFTINGRPTYPGRVWHGRKIEG